VRERQVRERQERERQVRERQVKREKLLGIDLFTVKEERWIRFSNHIMEKYGDFNSDTIENQTKRKKLRFLGDMLVQGGASIHVSDEERESSEYTDMKLWVSEKWKEWDENNE
jgi:methionine synthase II (cobalamin-independent)